MGSRGRLRAPGGVLGSAGGPGGGASGSSWILGCFNLIKMAVFIGGKLVNFIALFIVLS